MKKLLAVCLLAAAAALSLSVRADAPHIYAITGARIVTAAGSVIDNGTVVLRGGLIEAVGTDAAPSDALVVDGKGLTVYPGLIDMGNTAGVEIALPPEPRDAKTREEVERWKRHVILRPHVRSASHLRVDAPELTKLAAAGITTVLATPPGEVIRGQSALVNVVAPEDAPQIGSVADERAGLAVVRTPVLLHVAFPNRPRGSAYPESLMGVIAFVRQSFLDAQHYQLEQAHYERVKRGTARPVYDEALEAMQPAIARRIPVAFEADTAREIRRALGLARELELDAIIAGGRQAAEAASDLKAQNSRVLFSVNYPTRPKTLAPDADEAVRELRDRVNAPKTPAALDKAGVMFAFASSGLKESKDFVKNVAKAVKAGLPADAALRALTISAATIAGAADRLGTIEKGKIANLVVTDGDLFEEKTTIKHVFIDGRLVKIDPPEEPKREEGRPRPAQ